MNKNIGLKLYWITQDIFWLIFFAHIAVYYASPFVSLNPILPVWLFMGLLLSIFTITSRIALGFSSNTKTTIWEKDWFSSNHYKRFIRGLLAVSAIGVCLHMYSKYYLTNFRPISCLFDLRIIWIEIGHDLLPWYVRIASISGHLLSSFSYFGVFISSFALVINYQHSLSKRSHFFYLCGFLIIATLYAGFIGSRSAMLAYFLLSLAGALIGVCTQPKLNYKTSAKAMLITTALPLIVMFGFSSAVFANRIYCSANINIPAKDQEIQKQIESSQQVDNYFKSNCKDFAIDCTNLSKERLEWKDNLNEYCGSCGSAMLYLGHGIINFAQIIASDGRGQPVLLGFFLNLPKRLGLMSVDFTADDNSTRVYGKGSTTLAGGAYHDYGVFGVIITAIFLGILYGFALRLINRDDYYAMVGFVIYLTLFYIICMSNIAVGSNVISFPFIVFSSTVCIVACIYNLKARKTQNGI